MVYYNLHIALTSHQEPLQSLWLTPQISTSFIARTRGRQITVSDSCSQIRVGNAIRELYSPASDAAFSFPKQNSCLLKCPTAAHSRQRSRIIAMSKMILPVAQARKFRPASAFTAAATLLETHICVLALDATHGSQAYAPSDQFTVRHAQHYKKTEEKLRRPRWEAGGETIIFRKLYRAHFNFHRSRFLSLKHAKL